jgi:tRNA(fMet)-specific endonuclease VapC
MTLYVLDTDHISLYQKSHPQVVSRVQATDSREIAITIISAEEQLRGWLDAIRQASSGERLMWAYLGFRW